MPPRPDELALANALRAESEARIAEATVDAVAFRKQRLTLLIVQRSRKKSEAHEAEEKRKDEAHKQRLKLALTAHVREDGRKFEAHKRRGRKKERGSRGSRKDEK